MPMVWTEAAVAKVSLEFSSVLPTYVLTISQLFLGVLATSDVKVDHKALATYMGPGMRYMLLPPAPFTNGSQSVQSKPSSRNCAE